MVNRSNERWNGTNQFIQARLCIRLASGQVSQISDRLEGVIATATATCIVQTILEVDFVATLEQIDVSVFQELVCGAVLLLLLDEVFDEFNWGMSTGQQKWIEAVLVVDELWVANT